MDYRSHEFNTPTFDERSILSHNNEHSSCGTPLLLKTLPNLMKNTKRWKERIKLEIYHKPYSKVINSKLNHILKLLELFELCSSIKNKPHESSTYNSIISNAMNYFIHKCIYFLSSQIMYLSNQIFQSN